MREKTKREEEEQRRNKVQAKIWKKEAEDYTRTEKEKSDYIRKLNEEHATVLKSMFKETKKQPMSEVELLMNK